MKARILAASILALVILTLAPSARGDASQQLRRFTEGLESLQGRFVQRVFDANERIVEQSRGELAMARPDRFRWQYTEPFSQLIVADGERVWIFDPDLEQVTVRDQTESEAESPLSVLLDPNAIETRYLVQELGEAEGGWWLRLMPHQEVEGLRFADLVFEDDVLRAMHLHDNLGQRNVLLFEDWSRNPDPGDDRFRFEVPEGVDVIGER